MNKQGSLGFEGAKNTLGSVECLGQTFESDEGRREHYQALLAEKLKDPAFRETPGFPKGTDEAILRMSDPPYYTACPNPFLEDFVRVHGRPYDPSEAYSREPFAIDVSVGKTDALYKAHGYHTKVPHLAIVPSILHYTKPGDIVVDGFCGSGMTGVAAQWCGAAPPDYRRKLEGEWKKAGYEAPEWGVRRAILGDLGPAASFIAANYNTPFEVDEFAKAAQQILDEVEDELGWMYETLHSDGKTRGRINYTVWSEVFLCPECSGEIVFVEVALDPETKKVRLEFPCPSCSAPMTKSRLQRLTESVLDPGTNRVIQVTKRSPVLVNYKVGKSTFEKRPDAHDIEVLERARKLPLPQELPTDRMMHAALEAERWGDEWRAGVASFTHVHHIFLPRASQAIASLWRRANCVQDKRTRQFVMFFVEQVIWGLSLMARYAPTHFSQVNQYMSGRIRLLSQHAECSPWYILTGKLQRLIKVFSSASPQMPGAAITTGDCGHLLLPNDTVDYVFTDPPFGSNFAYAELNFIVEAWHRVFTNQDVEAIVSGHQKKETSDYQDLMYGCFKEYYRVLKSGRWMTVVFSNSSNAIWHAIQEAMGTAGFVVADVRTLDKKQGSFNQVHGVSVDQDLIISAYKPTSGLAQQFELGTTEQSSVWSFINEHLGNVPVFVGRIEGDAEIIAERTPQMLHDRMIAFFVQHGVAVPINSQDFFDGLEEKFPNRDGMYFLQVQVSEYDRRRTTVRELRQLDLFVFDEASATHWVRQQLSSKPQSFQDLQPQFMRHLQSWAKHEDTIELKEILELNFIHYDGHDVVPNQIHSYLSSNFRDLRKLEKENPTLKAKAADRWYVPDPKKEGDLGQLRLRTLLRQFKEYRTSTSPKIKQFRSEAIRAGFKNCYDEQDYQTIVDVAAKLPEKVIQEDEKLLMYYDVATMRLGV